MARNLPPVEVEFIKLTPDRLRTIRPTTALDIRENNSGSFHPDGLFSTLTFGPVGSKERDMRFSYIKTNSKVFHPKYFKELMKLKGLYANIISGKEYAIFDQETKDFVISDPIEGETGFSFFLKYFPQIEFKRNNSRQRQMRIDFLEKYRKDCLYENILILPAGLRDIVENENGRDTEGEVNAFYRRIIGASNSIASQTGSDSYLLDTSRVSIQNGFNNVFDFFAGLLKGKGGFIGSKWTKRGVVSGTRSVITSISTSTSELGSPTTFGYNQTAVGIFQACKSYQPMVVNAVLTITANRFQGNGAKLVDKNTMKSTFAQLSADEIDKWTTPSGIEKFINAISEENFRTRPITVAENYYLALIWTGEVDGKKCFKVIDGMDEIPEKFKDGVVRPITYVELFYLSRVNDWAKDIYFVSRYPITGNGSIFPTLCYIRTTIDSEARYMLDNSWDVSETVATAFPILENAKFTDSLAIHPARLDGLGADHDGDKMSSLSIMSIEAREEVYNYLNQPEAYIDGDGNMLASVYVDSVERVLANITGF